MLQGLSQSSLTPGVVSYTGVASAREKGITRDSGLGLNGRAQGLLRDTACVRACVCVCGVFTDICYRGLRMLGFFRNLGLFARGIPAIPLVPLTAGGEL